MPVYGYLPPEKLSGKESADWIAASGWRPAIIHGNGGNDFLFGSDGFNDTLYGDGADDHLYGYGGNDLLLGDQPGNLWGSSFGNDLLNGGAGNDTLRGGAGSDTLVGADGRDVFYFDFYFDTSPSLSSVDQVVDFQPGQDRIVIPMQSTDLQIEHPASNAAPGHNLHGGLMFDATHNVLYFVYDNGGYVPFAHFNTAISSSDITFISNYDPMSTG